MKYYQPCDECPDEKVCGIRSVFYEVREQTVAQLKKSSLAEIIKREEKLRRKGRG
jgi:DNA-binding IscR family transcriptional regulator